MYNILNMIFLFSGLLFVLSIIIYKLCISKINGTMKASNFVAGMTIFMGAYILSGIILSFFKPVMLLFALSPFIIGKFATYKREKIYCLIQIICVLISLILVF